jgi:hypothetical protein
MISKTLRTVRRLVKEAIIKKRNEVPKEIRKIEEALILYKNISSHEDR